MSLLGRAPESLRSPQDRRNCTLHAAWQAGHPTARGELITANRPVAVTQARWFVARFGGDLQEAIGAASIGLILAVDRWEPERGSLSLYARFYILRTIRDDQRLWRLPCVGKLASYGRSRLALALTGHGRDHLAALARGGSNGHLAHALIAPPDPAMTAIEDREARDQVCNQVRDWVRRLPWLERAVIRRRFGLNGDPQTWQSISVDLGRSKSWVQVIGKHALHHLREMF